MQIKAAREVDSADHEFGGRGGLTKHVIQRLTVEACVPIRIHSNVHTTLRYDLRTVQTMCLEATMNGTLHFVSLDQIVLASDNGNSSNSSSRIVTLIDRMRGRNSPLTLQQELL